MKKKCGLLERIGLLQTFSLKLEPLSLGSVSIPHISGLFTHHWRTPWHRLVLDLQLLQKLPLGLQQLILMRQVQLELLLELPLPMQGM